MKPKPISKRAATEGATDWKKVRAMRDQDIDLSDHPQWTAQEIAGATRRSGRGPQKAPLKARITIRLDADIVSYYRSLGRGWQTQLNDMLRKKLARRL
jgi:uncharacterized protein (DUF4415 family)